MVGKKIGMLTVLSIKKNIVFCKCDCGNECIKQRSNTINGNIFSCGCKRKPTEHIAKKVDHSDRIGKRNGNITITCSTQEGKHIVTCKCDCGGTFCINGSSFKHRKSCGKCEYRGSIGGMSKTPFYKIRSSILDRCYNSSSAFYHAYGGRGLTAENWKGNFNKFKDDFYEDYLKHIKEYGKDNTSLDRINNDLGYSKENCKWSTYKEQGRNRSNTIRINNLTIGEISEYTGESYSSIYYKYRKHNKKAKRND